MSQNPIKDRIKKIRMVLLDVDGVLTDGSLILGNTAEYKIFHVQDGLGIQLLQKAGIRVGFLTSRRSEAVANRAKELNIDLNYQGVDEKLELLQEIIAETHVKSEEICYMGDDLPDLPVLRRVGFSAVVANARNEVKAVADCVTEHAGGKGAVRELAEIILKTQGKWDAQLKLFE